MCARRWNTLVCRSQLPTPPVLTVVHLAPIFEFLALAARPDNYLGGSSLIERFLPLAPQGTRSSQRAGWSLQSRIFFAYQIFLWRIASSSCFVERACSQPDAALETMSSDLVAQANALAEAVGGLPLHSTRLGRILLKRSKAWTTVERFCARSR